MKNKNRSKLGGSGTQSPLKSKPLRNPGQSLDEQIESLIYNDFLGWTLAPLFLWVISGLEWFAVVREVPRMPLLYAALATAATAIMVWQFFRVRERARALRLGRDGERAVGQFLESLRADGAQVFHDVVAEGFNLDHVVVAPQGIFLIETKTWRKRRTDSKISTRDGNLFRDGYLLDPNPLSQAVASAAWLRQMLRESTGRRLAVWPVVLFPGWFVEPMDESTKRQGWVLSGREFPAFLARESSRLAAEDVSLCSFHLARYIRAQTPSVAPER